MKTKVCSLLLAILIAMSGITFNMAMADPCVLAESDAEADGGGEATELNGAFDIFILDSRAYIASNVDDSLSIFDISDPTMITELGTIDHDGATVFLDGATGVFVKEDRAYVAANVSDSLSIFDVSDPTMITVLGTIMDGAGVLDSPSINGAFSVFVKGDYAYVASNVDDSLTIINVSDPTQPFHEDGILNFGEASALDGAQGVTVKGNRAYVSSALDDSLSIFDISNPKNIVELGFIQDGSQGGAATSLNGARNAVVRGNYAYVTSFDDDSLSIFDISDPTMITQTDFIVDNALGGDATEIDGAYDVFIKGNNAYVASLNADSISIFDITDPTNIIELGFLDDGSPGGTLLNGAISVFVDGNFAYVASNVDDSISSFDVRTDTDCVVPGVDINGNGCLELTHNFSNQVLFLNTEGIGFDKGLSCRVRTPGKTRIKVRPRRIRLKSKNGFSKAIRLILSKRRVRSIRNENRDLSVNLRLRCKRGRFTDDMDVDILSK